jgi:glyoxylase-like metal-dependent hydrolase (beta-lactamase superfamily II)
MREILQDVYQMDSIRGGNVYLLTAGNGLTLVDSGMPGGADAIETQIQAAGFPPSAPRLILLTHSHIDHIGSAAELTRRTGAKLLAHRREILYIENKQKWPTASLLRRVFVRLTDPAMSGPGRLKVDHPLEDEEQVDALGGLRVIPSSGHTPGSISLYQTERRILFCGNALFNRNPVSGRPGIRLPPSVLSMDMKQAR